MQIKDMEPVKDIRHVVEFDLPVDTDLGAFTAEFEKLLAKYKGANFYPSWEA